MSSREENLRRWLVLSEEWAQSKLSQKEYCASKGMSQRSLTYQRTQLISHGIIKPYQKPRKSKVSPEEMRFVPLTLVAQTVSQKTAVLAQAKPGFIEIQLPHGIVIKVPTC